MNLIGRTRMDCRRARYVRRGLAVAALGASMLAGCARKTPPPTADSATGPAALRSAATGATVFTDTAMFRRVCAEADSGLTPASARRCTPRDQSLRMLPSDTPRRRVP
jgi:hypothetical protein